MKTRNKKLRIKTRKTKNTNTNTRKMKGGSFFTDLYNRFVTPENKELSEDLKKLSTHKETIRKTMQSMYDTAKDSTKFNANYTSFTTTVNEINKLVIDINNHRAKPTNATVPANTTKPTNSMRSTNPTGGIGAANATAAGAGAIGAGAAAVVGIKDAKNALMGSPQP